MLLSHDDSCTDSSSHRSKEENYLVKTSSTRTVEVGQNWIKSLAAAAFYGVCSCSMAFINKAVISSYRFNFPFFIMSCQMTLTILFLEILRYKDFIKLSPYSLQKGRSFFWPALFYAIHSVTALSALGGMTIPMYGAIKRCAPFATLVLSVAVFRKKLPSAHITFSVLLITAGCVIAGIGDLSFEFKAYAYGLISVIAQSLYLLLVQYAAEDDTSTFEILQMNSYNGVLFFFLTSVTTQEINLVISFSDVTDFGFLGCFTAELCLGSILNYSLFLCTVLNSALTTSLVGVIKSVIQTLIGFVTFGGVEFHPLNIAGLTLNMCGGFVYTHAKYKERKEQRILQKTEEETNILCCSIGSDNSTSYKPPFVNGTMVHNSSPVSKQHESLITFH